MPDVPPFVLDRAFAKEPLFTADEVATWPPGTLEPLVGAGVLVATDNAQSVACDVCGHDHVETVEYIPAPTGNGLRAYIACPENGRAVVSLDRLRRWRVNVEKLAEVGLIVSPSEHGAANLETDLSGLATALRDLLESGETSEGFDSDEFALEDVEPGSRVHSAVCRVQRHYPTRKLPAPKARNPWRELLRSCRRENDHFQRQNRAHIHAQQLLDWVESELASLTRGTTSRKASRSKDGSPPKRSWTQGDLDEAIRKYKSERASTYNDLVDGVKRGRAGAKKSARDLFGRNAVVRALGVKSAAMVSKSQVWQAIADELKLRKPSRLASRRPVQRIGLDIAMEDQAQATNTPILDQAVEQETIRLIERSMPVAEAEATTEKLRRGEITDEAARELVEVFAQQQRDNRTRKVRQTP